MLKDDEIIEKLNKKFKIIQKVSGYKYGEDTILLFKLFQDSLNKKNIKLLDIGKLKNPMNTDILEEIVPKLEELLKNIEV